MKLQEFIKKYRTEIDSRIKFVLETEPKYKNDNERRLWILNDEGLYRWARSEGVKI